jgi:hypothetical protein
VGRVSIWLTLGLLAATAPVAAQTAETTSLQAEPRPVTLSVDPSDGALRVGLGTLLLQGGLTQALQSGLPLRIRVVAELWKDRFFDGQEGRSEWRATLVYDPLERRYRFGAASQDGEVEAGEQAVEDLAEAQLQLEALFSLPLRPSSQGTFYYTTEIEIETLSLSDLDELQRWLRGDLAPAVGREGDVEGAVGRGLRRLMVRMLSLPTRRVRLRTDPFRFDPALGVTGGE